MRFQNPVSQVIMKMNPMHNQVYTKQEKEEILNQYFQAKKQLINNSSKK